MEKQQKLRIHTIIELSYQHITETISVSDLGV